MILSVSRRTDVPAFFAPWFYRRLQTGEVWVRNPRNPRLISRLLLNPEGVDGFVFWTKNPAPMLEGLSLLDPYPYYFLVTLTPYGPDVERRFPPWEEVARGMIRLAKIIGPERVKWRYDPVLFSEKYDGPFHRKTFLLMATLLEGHTLECITSFLETTPLVRRYLPHCRAPGKEEGRALLAEFSRIATQRGMVLRTCAMGEGDLPGIEKSRCIDGELLGRIGGVALKSRKDPGQRPACGCHRSIDIGAYATCLGGCLYCYAERGRSNRNGHDPESPLLGVPAAPGDKIVTRPLASLRQDQLELF